MSQLRTAPASSRRGHILPSSVSQVGTVTKYELVNYFRSRRFFVLLIIGNGVYYFAIGIPYQFGESLLFSILSLMAVLGFTFFFSSLFKSSSISILVTAILFLFAFQIIQTLVSVFAQIEPWFILTYGSGIIGNVLADTYPTTQPIRGAGPGGREGTTFAVTIPEGLTIILGYFVVTAILGLLLFQRKEFT